MTNTLTGNEFIEIKHNIKTIQSKNIKLIQSKINYNIHLIVSINMMLLNTLIHKGFIKRGIFYYF